MSEKPSSCPVDHGKAGAPPTVCSSDRMNSNNNMPYLPNDKDSNLSTKREVSSIPMSEEGGKKWVYPSEHQFFSALKKKGWNGAEEKDMSPVVAIHNAVNEMTWQQILKFEALHKTEEPKLKKFLGRPNDLSPKARFMNLLGYAKPFDRHDWIVDRDGHEVRYVIDFYNGNVTGEDKLRGKVGMYVDARPALDSPSAAFDRLRLYMKENVRL